MFKFLRRLIRGCPDVKLQVSYSHPLAKPPFRKRATDVGYDITAIQTVDLQPWIATSIKTGIHISAPPGWYYTIDGRSGLSDHNIISKRGIIDASYVGELDIKLFNFSDSIYTIKVGDRIAQIILCKQYTAEFEDVTQRGFDPEYSLRGENGFGSSGR